MTTMEHATSSVAPPAIQQRVPRDVSAATRWSLRLGGGVGIAGWAMFGFGMIFFWSFAMNADVASLWQFNGETERAMGQVTHSEKTKFTTGGSKSRRGKPVFANGYVFTSADGNERWGVSYATDHSLRVGQVVEVEHPKGRPGISRIVGMRRAVLPGVTALVALGPAVGLWMILINFRRGSRYADLLENGRLAWGKMVSKETTMARVNRKPVYKMTFEFTADNRRTYQVVAKTHATGELEDEEHELVLYEAGDPSVAVVADALPAGIRVDEKGRVHEKVPVFVWVLLPMFAVIGHGTYVFTTYL